MSPRPAASIRPARQRAFALLSLVAFLVLLISIARPGGAAAEGGGALTAEPVLSGAAAGERQLFGASPEEAPGEVWGVGRGSGGLVHLIRYTEAAGWEAVPDPVDESGATLPLEAEAVPLTASAGRTTPAGGVATVTAAASEQGFLESNSPQYLLVRNPGGQFRAIAAPGEPTMHKNETLFLRANLSHIVVKLAAVQEADGDTGAFVVPNPGGAVLHYDGTKWAREQICVNGAVPPNCNVPGGFNILAVEATGPDNAWMLARRQQPSNKGEAIVLLRREADETWRQQSLGPGLGAIFAKEKSELGGSKVIVAPRELGQPLTVTSDGVWVDATVQVAGGKTTDATIYYDIGAGDPREGEVSGSWCDLPASVAEPTRGEICKYPLGFDLAPGESRSFAWAGSGAEGDFGTRAITGVGQGAMLIFENGAFSKVPLVGGGGGEGGAALSAPDQGWLNSPSGPLRLTREPVPSGLRSWPVPFRRPLLGIAAQPDKPVGSLSSEALAVGASGEVARYLPGEGWQPESLLSGSGARATPNLRAVAWPEPGFAYAVGDEGAMWLWRASTGLWEADPGAPPNLIRGNFTAIAFDPAEPSRGYAVGKQGLLLGFGKRWAQEALPFGLDPEINITSVAFSGGEALATWRLDEKPATPDPRPVTTGGVIVNRGSGWQVEEEATKALASLAAQSGEAGAQGVAGLPDGGAVVVDEAGEVIEREAAGAPWHAVPGAPLGFPSSVAAVREGGQVRAILTVGHAGREDTDYGQAFAQPPPGRGALILPPYDLPRSGVLIRQTATGWTDEERQSYPQPPIPTNQKPPLNNAHFDIPREPDPLLAILVAPNGSEGWAVGGQTGEEVMTGNGPYLKEGLQTAAVMRYGPAAAPPENAGGAPISVPAEAATFAVGGGAQCYGACADLVNTGIGPDVWLRSAVGRAASIAGLRGFLYAGKGVSENLELSTFSPHAFGEEEAAYANRLDPPEAGSLPVFAAPSSTDLYESSPAIFAAQFSKLPAPLGLSVAPGITPISAGNRGAGNYSYSFESTDGAGLDPVRVIVLDESTAPLIKEKKCWLGEELAKAKGAERPAIVLGNREVGTEAELRQILVTGASAACPQEFPGAASAYLYETSGNIASSLSWGSASIPAFGTGSLGYVPIPALSQQLLPASGFLLASVDTRPQDRNPATNVAPVSARLIPSIGSLALDALDGTFLRRSQTALFEALARRPVAGIGCIGGEAVAGGNGICAPDPYDQIPARCIGAHGSRPCGAELVPEYQFTSSRPDIANFVKVDPNSTNPRAVFLNPQGKPVPDPSSGLLCAFNSGTTTVSIVTGGLSYSVPVTVQPGSVQRPCGTVPRTDLPAAQPGVTPPPPPPAPQPHFKSPSGPLPPPPVPTPVSSPIPTPIPPQPIVVHHPAPQVPSFFASPASVFPVPAFVPPPPPTVPEPAPPSGTSTVEVSSPVAQSAVAPEEKREEGLAVSHVHHMSVYSPEGFDLPPAIPIVAILALVIGASGLVGTRRRERLAYVPLEDRRSHV